MVIGRPRSRYAATSRSSQAILSREYCQYGLRSGVDSVTGSRARRGLVGRGRADEDVLAAAALDQVEAGAHVVGGEGQPVDDGVELEVAERLAGRCGVPDVGAQLPDALGQRPVLAHAAVQDGQVEAAFDRQAGARRADDAAAADEEDSLGTHGRTLGHRHRPAALRTARAAGPALEERSTVSPRRTRTRARAGEGLELVRRDAPLGADDQQHVAVRRQRDRGQRRARRPRAGRARATPAPGAR